MFPQDSRTAPTFARSGVTLDWSREGMQQKFDSSALLSWVRSSPACDQIHVYVGNASFKGDRALMRRLQAMGCTVTCRQYQLA